MITKYCSYKHLYLPFLLKSFISYAPQIFQLLWSVVCLPTFGVKKLLNSEQTCLSRLLMKMFYKLLEWFGQWSKINLKQLKLKDVFHLFFTLDKIHLTFPESSRTKFSPRSRRDLGEILGRILAAEVFGSRRDLG